jgi:DNA-directed RNA polymerase subunit RPC12/RpoP
MVEIIKRGTKNTCTCSECGCIFSYEDEDIENIYQGSYFSVSEMNHKNIVRCPQCGTEIVLKQTK